MTDRRGTRMSAEAREAPERCAAQVARNAELLRAAGGRLRDLAPPFAATLARGSSDQAAAFAKHLLEVHAHVPVVSQPPSLGALYHATSPRFRDVPLIAISQSGRSPDLIAAAEDAKRQGALVVAVVNETDSPLASLAEIVVPVLAGPETSVAATKSFVCTLVALAHLVGEWAEDTALLDAVARIGTTLHAAAAQDWSAALPELVAVSDMLVLGRGPTLPIAGEAALKLKETSGLHAEAFSAAEVAHGPMTLIEAGDPVLAFVPTDVAATGFADRLGMFADRGARILATGDAAGLPPGTWRLPTVASGHPATDAIAAIQSFYALADTLSLARGRDPDSPPYLAKVTRTL